MSSENIIIALEDLKKNFTTPNLIQEAIIKLETYERVQEKLDERYDGDVSIELFVDLFMEEMQSREEGHFHKARILTNEDADAYDEWKSQKVSIINNPEVLTGRCEGCSVLPSKKTFQKECLGCKRQWWPNVNGDYYEKLPDNYK